MLINEQYCCIAGVNTRRDLLILSDVARFTFSQMILTASFNLFIQRVPKQCHSNGIKWYYVRYTKYWKIVSVNVSIFPSTIICHEKKNHVLFGIFVILVVGLSPLLYINSTTTMIFNILIAICTLFMLLLSTYASYKMFVIAKSKRADKRVSPSTDTSKDENIRKNKIKFKEYFYMFLGGWLLLSFLLPVHYFFNFHTLGITSGESFYDRQVLLFHRRASTFVSINSTLNCVTFFWRNSLLRREGMKIIYLKLQTF